MAAVHYQAGAFPPEDRLRWRELISVAGPRSGCGGPI